MPRPRPGLTFFAATVAISALGLVAFGVLALGRALKNAEAAAAQESRSATAAAIRALRSRVESPSFLQQLPEEDRITITSTRIVPPAALPPPAVIVDANFITESSIDVARRLEFAEGKPDEALVHLAEALRRPDLTPRDRALLQSTAIWTAHRNGRHGLATTYRDRVRIRDLSPSVASSLAIFDVTRGRSLGPPLLDRIAALDSRESSSVLRRIREILRERDAQHERLSVDDSTKALVTLERKIGRNARLRRALTLTRQTVEELRRSTSQRVRGVQSPETSPGDVHIYVPTSETSSAGHAWLLSVREFVELSRPAREGDDVSTPDDLDLYSGAAREDSIPVFEGLHASPTRRTTRAADDTLTLVLLGALATVLALGLWLLLRAFRRERDALAGRTDFLRSITHELRTPLASIRLFAETLATGRAPDAATRDEYADLIAVEAGRLSTLVENALELGRTERGERSWRFEVSRLDELVQDSVTLFEPIADESSMRMTFRSAPVTAKIDRDGVRQILGNLFENARKYAAKGGEIDVEVSLDTSTNRAVVEVRDFGPGIDASERDRVFDRFVRGRAQQDGHIPGAGLGLAIARSIAHAHGGELRHEPREPGSCFVLSLPIVKEHGTAPPGSPSPRAGADS